MPKKSHDRLTPQDVAAIACNWTQQELLEMKAIVDSLLSATSNEFNESDEPNESDKKGKGGGGYFEDKMINGCGPYRYLRYLSEGKRKSAYLGKV